MSDQDSYPADSVFRRRFLPVVVILVFGGSLSLAVFLAAYAWEQNAIEREFRSLAADRFHAITRTFEEFTRLLDFTDNVFMVGPPSDSPEFVNYVRSLKDLFERDISRYPSLRSMVWVPRVPRDRQDAYEKAARAVFDPKFQLKGCEKAPNLKSGDTPTECFPYYLGIPATWGHDRIGENLALDPVISHAMKLACDGDGAIAIAPISISPNNNDRFGYQIYQPLYNNVMVNDAASRQRALAGYLCVDLDVGTLINKAMAGIPPVGIEVIVRDDSETPGVTLCRHESRLAASTEASTGPYIDPVAQIPGELQACMKTNFFGRNVTLQCDSAAPFWVGRTKWEAWLLLGIGLVLTLVVAGSQFNRARHEAAIERTVASRMEALCKAPEPRS